MDTTATINLQSITKSEQAHIVRHNARDNQTYDNQDIDPSKSKLNVYKKYNDEDELLKNHYQDYINERNAKLDDDFSDKKISLEQYTKRKQTLEQYLNGSNGTKEKKAYTDIVATVGNVESLEEFKKRVPPDKWREYFTRVYGLTAERINNLEGFAVANLHVHFDEGGMPHGHIDSINNGVTAAGKPSTTLNAALKASYGNNDSRQNLRQLRDELDSAMIDDCNAVAQDMDIDLPLNLVRLGNKGGRTMKEYKALKQHEDDVNERERHAKAMVADVNKTKQEMSEEKNEIVKGKQKLSDSENNLLLRQMMLDKREKEQEEKDKKQAKIEKQQRETAKRQAQETKRLENEKANFGGEVVAFRSDLLDALYPKANPEVITRMAITNKVVSQQGKLKETVFEHVFRKIKTVSAKVKDKIVNVVQNHKDKDQSEWVNDAVNQFMNEHSGSKNSKTNKQKQNQNDLER